jgi:choline dehydrogenase-like flavoprotein
MTVKRGRRQSTAVAFLNPVKKRPNLVILTDTLTRRVLIEGGRAVGVEVEQGGRAFEIRAAREVILCCGVFGSPQLLMLSGVGPRQELESHGLACVHDLPGVGRNLQEHLSVAVQYSTPTTVPFGLSWRTVPWFAWQFVKYVATRKGMFNNPVLHAGGFIRTDPALPRPDIQLLLMPTHRDAKGRMGYGHGYGLIAILLRPESRGHVSLQSADPKAPPVIEYNVFDEPEDLETLARGVEIAREVLRSRFFDPVKGEEIAPGAHVRDREGVKSFIRRTCDTVFHAVGTCRMGVEPDCVVGPDLKVHGIEGLRVADASIMPTLIGGNTNAPAIMIGEKASDLILGRPPLAPEDPRVDQN